MPFWDYFKLPIRWKFESYGIKISAVRSPDSIIVMRLNGRINKCPFLSCEIRLCPDRNNIRSGREKEASTKNRFIG